MKEDLPLLRFRTESGEDDYYEKPVNVIGRVNHVDLDTVRIAQGPTLTVELYVEDLATMFDDDEEFTLAVFADAADHGDAVTVALAPGRLTYENKKQLARLESTT